VTDIEMVELLKDVDEVKTDAQQLDSTRRLLIQLRRKEIDDGSQSTPTSAQRKG